MNFFENIKLEKKINLITENFYKTENSYPSRNELSNFLIETLSFSDVDNIEKNSLLETSQIFVDKVISTKQHIFKILQSIYSKEFEIEYLNFLIKEDRIASIININYDLLLYGNEKIKKLSPFDKDTFAIGKTKLYKPLGEFNSIDSCAITSQDLKKLKVLPFYKNYFNSIRYDLKLRPNVICAFDLQDSDFFEILEFIFGDFPNLLKDIYLVTNENITNIKVLNFIKKYNVQVLNYDSFNFLKKLYNYFNDINSIDDELLEYKKNTSEITENNTDKSIKNITDIKPITKSLKDFKEITENIENQTNLFENSTTNTNIYNNENMNSEIIYKENINKNEIDNNIKIETNLNDTNKEIQFSLFDNIQENYIPKNIILENNEFSLETGIEKKYSSVGLDKFPIFSTNLPENLSFEDIEVIGNAQMKIGDFASNCFIRILSSKTNNISLLEIKSRDVKLRFSIIKNALESIKFTNDYFYYEIFSSITLGRSLVVLKMLESLFSGISMEFIFKTLSGKITLNNLSEVVKIKTIYSLFASFKSENLKLQMNKLENINNIFYLLNLELLLKKEHFLTWCDFEINKSYLNIQDNVTFKRLHHLDKKTLLEEVIVLKSPISEKDIFKDKFIGKRKICTIYLKKIRGEF